MMLHLKTILHILHNAGTLSSWISECSLNNQSILAAVKKLVHNKEFFVWEDERQSGASLFELANSLSGIWKSSLPDAVSLKGNLTMSHCPKPRFLSKFLNWVFGDPQSSTPFMKASFRMLFEACTKPMAVASCQGCWCTIVRHSWFCGRLLVVVGCPFADPHLDSCLLQGAAMCKVSQVNCCLCASMVTMVLSSLLLVYFSNSHLSRLSKKREI